MNRMLNTVYTKKTKVLLLKLKTQIEETKWMHKRNEWGLSHINLRNRRIGS